MKFYQSSIGKKWVVALTGLVLVGYVIGHMLGNLQIFAGPAQINAYGTFLHSHNFLLWLVRSFLIACFVLHIVFTVKLALENRAARPESYAMVRREKASWAGRSMVWSGLIVLCFVIFHILHFTAQTVNRDFQTFEDPAHQHDIYKMVIVGFQNPFATGFYILGMFLLCLHLSHGFGSFFQTLGLNTRRVAPLLVNGGRVLAWTIFVGYISIPVAVMLHILQLK